MQKFEAIHFASTVPDGRREPGVFHAGLNGHDSETLLPFDLGVSPVPGTRSQKREGAQARRREEKQQELQRVITPFFLFFIDIPRFLVFFQARFSDPSAHATSIDVRPFHPMADRSPIRSASAVAGASVEPRSLRRFWLRRSRAERLRAFALNLRHHPAEALQASIPRPTPRFDLCFPRG